MDHSTVTGPSLAMLLENPLLILIVVFGVGGLLVYWMSRESAPPTEQESQSENSASRRGA